MVLRRVVQIIAEVFSKESFLKTIRGNYSPQKNAIRSGTKSSSNAITEKDSKNLLEKHTAPNLNIDIDFVCNPKNDEYSLEIGEEEVINEIPQRTGVYRSRGITVYIPRKLLVSATYRHKFDSFPGKVHDDTRIVYFK